MTSPDELDTVDLAEEYLSSEEVLTSRGNIWHEGFQVDMRGLRNISAARGLVNSQLRARVWPVLLDVENTELLPLEDYLLLAKAPNEFRTIIAADVRRSLFHYFDSTQEAQRAQQRTKLERLLNAVVSFHEGRVHYYQGLHDIASIMLLTLGESSAFSVLCKLTEIRLRDCTQSTLEPVAELLKLQIPILRKVDGSLAKHLESMNIPCYFAISWFITWFSHDVPQFNEVCRLFDFFLAAHPIMPLYIGAVGMHAARSDLLRAQDMSELHKALVNLRVLEYLSTDELILNALTLYHKHSPKKIARELPFRLQHCVTPFAYLENNQWVLPSTPPNYQCWKPHKWILHTLVGGMVTNSALYPSSIKLASFAGFGICAFAVVAYKLLEGDLDEIHKSIWEGLFNQNQ